MSSFYINTVSRKEIRGLSKGDVIVYFMSDASRNDQSMNLEGFERDFKSIERN